MNATEKLLKIGAALKQGATDSAKLAKIAAIVNAIDGAATSAPTYDYSKYGPTSNDVYGQFPNGLPVDWDWAAWGAAHPGQPYPGQPSTDTGSGGGGTESGFALVRGGAPLVNPATKDVTVGTFTFNVPEGVVPDQVSGATAKISISGGSWFHAVTYAVSGPTSIPENTYEFAGTNGTVLDLQLAPGDYSMPLSVDGPPDGQQDLDVQYYQ